MAEFKDAVPHTGGVLTIHKKGSTYSLGYRHANANRMALVQILAIKGKPVAIVPMGGISLNPPEPDPPEVHTMMPTDAEGMFGRRCPKCDSYFRAGHIGTTFCPYCETRAPWRDFITAEQREFVRRQHDAILAALTGPDGDTTVDFDAQNAALTRKDNWVYEEERQQTRFMCSDSSCATESDVLGEYVRCPGCGKRTARDVITRKMANFSSDFESDAANIPKDQHELRQRRWQHYILAIVAEFEALGRDLSAALALLPCTPKRRKAIELLPFQHPIAVAEHIEQWFGFDILENVNQVDRDFLHRMFNRRHLFTHRGGKVDQEYLDKTGDGSVRLNEAIKVDSKEVRRLLTLVELISTNLLNGFDSIT